MADAEKAGQVAQVAKMVLDKLTEAAQAVHSTASEALPHVVKAYAARQVGYMAVSLLMLLAGVALMLLERNKSMGFERDSDGPSGAFFVVFVGAILGVLGVLGSIFNAGETLAVLADPTGAFILSLLGR